MSLKNVIILAAGDGKRMKSKLPKVMCEVLQKPMLKWVLDSAKNADINSICVVLGKHSDTILPILDENVSVVYQESRLGTGHATLQALDFLKNHPGGDTLVLIGDAPFMDADTINNAYKFHKASNNSATVITAALENPFGYGRIVRNSTGNIQIIEEIDADDATKRIHEINSSTYWFKTDELIEVLPKITNNNNKKEYYLNNTVDILVENGKQVDAFRTDNSDIVLGANDPYALFELNQKAKQRIIEKLLRDGVQFVSTDGVIISPDASIAPSAKILPNTIITGHSTIEEGAVIGPNSTIDNSHIGKDCVVNSSQIYSSCVDDNSHIGPFSHIRPNSKIGKNVKIGAFVETKNSSIDSNTSVAHLTYVGDSDVGSNVNFGCGCVTVNYDGSKKYRTVIKDGAFIGCNTNLIAPVTVEANSYIAAGSTITDDVSQNSLAIARARQQNKPDWVTKKNIFSKKR